MAAVLFSKLGPMGGAILPTVISRYCLHTPGFRGVPKADCEEVPSHLFREALRGFVAQWDTKGFHSEALNGEVRLWESAFYRQKDDSRVTGIEIHRYGVPDIFAAEILGEEGVVVNEEDPNDLEKRMNKLKESDLPVKERVSVCVESPLALPISFECNPKDRFFYYWEKHNPVCRFVSLHTSVPILFSLAPTVEKMRRVVTSGNISLVQYFSESAPCVKVSEVLVPRVKEVTV